MPRIRQLPPEVITKIAAGEVIERPASVVKELLENALDAGATRIVVDIEQGGAELIRVVDNGCGIEPGDLPLAFASHATSKLNDADDLFRVRSLGFRGEALASIGGVSRTRLQSRPAAADCGAEITCEGGERGPVRPWNGAPGTRIEVRHLFYNTPVRRRFLRGAATEMGHIAEMITRVALAFPAVAFRLTHNEREVFDVPGSAALPDRLGLFFGGEVRDQLIPISASQGAVRLGGFLVNPACDRGTARMLYVFVNGRWVRDRSLVHALQEAYRGLVMSGRYPVAFVFLELPADQVDVNVHPTKIEVRFRDPQPLYHLVLAAARESLRRAELTPALQVGRGFVPPLSPTTGSIEPPIWRSPADDRQASLLESLAAGRPIQPPPSPPITAGDQQSGEAKADGSPAMPPPFKALQLYDAYLVVETPAGMLVIDQHALHERVLYEQWKERVRAGTLERQGLLVPEPVDLPAEQASLALDHRELLRQLGFEVQDFGGGTVLLTSLPAMIQRGTPGEVLRSAVAHLAGYDRLPEPEQLLDDLLKMLACRSAIKAGDHLSPEEIAALVEQRHLADDTHHCPHGRPTALLLSKQELDRQFKRI